MEDQQNWLVLCDTLSNLPLQQHLLAVQPAGIRQTVEDGGASFWLTYLRQRPGRTMSAHLSDKPTRDSGFPQLNEDPILPTL